MNKDTLVLSEGWFEAETRGLSRVEMDLCQFAQYVVLVYSVHGTTNPHMVSVKYGATKDDVSGTDGVLSASSMNPRSRFKWHRSVSSRNLCFDEFI